VALRLTQVDESSPPAWAALLQGTHCPWWASHSLFLMPTKVRKWRRPSSLVFSWFQHLISCWAPFSSPRFCHTMLLNSLQAVMPPASCCLYMWFSAWSCLFGLGIISSQKSSRRATPCWVPPPHSQIHFACFCLFTLHCALSLCHHPS
jgi:hypothetical protein